MSGEIKKIEGLLNETVKLLKSFDFVHSILLFGSRARGISGRDIDICIIPSKELDLRDRLFLESSVPSDIDISFFYELVFL
jgi:predicted nucleotidyltransferase